MFVAALWIISSATPITSDGLIGVFGDILSSPVIRSTEMPMLTSEEISKGVRGHFVNEPVRHFRHRKDYTWVRRKRTGRHK